MTPSKMSPAPFIALVFALLCLAPATRVRAAATDERWFALDGTPVTAGNAVSDEGYIHAVDKAVVRVTHATTPKTEGTVLLFAGGGYQLLDYRHEGVRTADTLNAFGYDVAMLEYHVNAGPRTRDAALEDARAAWKLASDHPDRISVGSHRLIIMGYSAGGHLAARLVRQAAESDGRQPDDLVLVYPAYLDEHAADSAAPLVRAPAQPHPRLVALIASDDRPAWIEGCKRYVDDWQQNGGYAVFHQLKDGGHGFGMKPNLAGEAAEWPQELRYLLENGPKPGVGPFNTFLPWYLGNVRGRLATFEKEAAADQGAIVFLGDSITRKWDLAAAFPQLHLANRGIAGDTTRGMLCRLQETVLNLHPKAIVLMGGINDLSQSPRGTPQTVAANVRAMLEQIRTAQPHTPVLVCETLPSTSAPQTTVAAVNAAVDAAIADFQNVQRIRTYAAFLNPDGTENRSLYVDGTHPNAAGYAVWAKIMEPKLNEVASR